MITYLDNIMRMQKNGEITLESKSQHLYIGNEPVEAVIPVVESTDTFMPEAVKDLRQPISEATNSLISSYLFLTPTATYRLKKNNGGLRKLSEDESADITDLIESSLAKPFRRDLFRHTPRGRHRRAS